jgi:hypothetical protein
MEKDRRIIELLLALVFIGILLFASIIILREDQKETQQVVSPIIINNYNSYTNENTEYTIVNPVKVTQVTQTINQREKTHYNDEKETNSADYTDYSGQERREDFLGSYVQEYYVYVLNKEKTGRYFTVAFELKDKNGYVDRELVTLYLRSDEKEKFAYRDIQFERNEIVDWSYEVIPETY